MPSPQFFDGQALVSWSDPDITVAVPWYIGLMFRTRQPAGTLMQANAGPSSTINLMVSYFLVSDKCLNWYENLWVGHFQALKIGLLQNYSSGFVT